MCVWKTTSLILSDQVPILDKPAKCRILTERDSMKKCKTSKWNVQIDRMWRKTFVFDLDRRIQSLHERIERKCSAASVLFISSSRLSLLMIDFHLFAWCDCFECIQAMRSSLSRIKTHSFEISASNCWDFNDRWNHSQTFKQNSDKFFCFCF
jgi:hypothetical protein